MNKVFNIVSYGESIKHFQQKESFPNETTIGVNDVGKIVDVDYLLLVDHPGNFTRERVDTIKRTLVLNYLIVDLSWFHFLQNLKCVPITLTKNRSEVKPLELKKDTLVFSDIPYSYNSPFIAACLAYRMGATEIRLYGVDFINDSSKDDDFHHKNIRDFKNLYSELNRLGVKLYTTPESRLSEFIPIIQSIKIAETA